jgi:hypothetical protein
MSIEKRDPNRTMNRFDRLLAELGIICGDHFEFELGRFDMSPRAWLEGRLRAMGWMKRSEVAAPPKCERECCR